jgi:hypothetical protein
MKDSYNIRAKGMGSGRGRVSGRAFRMSDRFMLFNTCLDFYKPVF